MTDNIKRPEKRKCQHCVGDGGYVYDRDSFIPCCIQGDFEVAFWNKCCDDWEAFIKQVIEKCQPTGYIESASKMAIEEYRTALIKELLGG